MENNEIRTPRRLFEELIERNKKIQEADIFIMQEKKKYFEAVKDVEEEKEINRKEVLKIRNKPIRLGVNYLIEEIATKWDVDADKLIVDVEFVDTAKYGKIGKNKFLKICENESFDGLIKCNLIVEYEGEGFDRTECLKLPLNLKHEQNNGQKLKEFLEVETVFRGWALYTDFKCPDYRNLIFEFLYDTLIDMRADEFKPRNKKCELILNAYERELQNLFANDQEEKVVKPLHIV